MTAQLEDYILDNGLAKLDTEASHIMICAAEPTTYALSSVNAANALGYKSFGAGSAFGSPAAGSPSGRKVSSVSVTDGTILTSGTASWWAVIDAVGATPKLMAHGSLSATQVVAATNTFSLASFDIRIPAF